VMVDGDWTRVQAQVLLKAIVSHGSQNIPKDRLAEALWPRSPREISDNNFKVSLHRLRKSLEPGMDKVFGSAYLHVRNNLVSLDSELCGTDADRFESLILSGKAEERSGQERKAIDAYTQAVDLYSGDFMAQDLYTDWIEQRRVVLRNHYIETLRDLGRLYERLGSVGNAIASYSKAVEADPLLEEAYQRLMVLYSRNGKNNLAIRTYQKCRQTLHEEIQAEPEPLTEEIYRSILLSSPKA